MSEPVRPNDIPQSPPARKDRAFESGTIRVGSGGIKIPATLDDSGKHGFTILGFEPVVVAILLGAITFIGFIAYLISQMPVPAK